MQTQEKRNRRRIKTALGVTGALVGATLTGAALLGAGPQHAQETVQARSTEFPFATLRSTQRMRLNVANVTANPPNDTPPPCRVLFRLFDSEGRVVATATSMVEPGKTAQITNDVPDGMPGRIRRIDHDLHRMRAAKLLPAQPVPPAQVTLLEVVCKWQDVVARQAVQPETGAIQEMRQDGCNEHPENHSADCPAPTPEPLIPAHGGRSCPGFACIGFLVGLWRSGDESGKPQLMPYRRCIDEQETSTVTLAVPTAGNAAADGSGVQWSAATNRAWRKEAMAKPICGQDSQRD